MQRAETINSFGRISNEFENSTDKSPDSYYGRIAAFGFAAPAVANRQMEELQHAICTGAEEVPERAFQAKAKRCTN